MKVTSLIHSPTVIALSIGLMVFPLTSYSGE